MKLKEKRTTTRTDECQTGIVCDLCKKQSKGHTWASQAYDATETTIESKSGSSYPEGGNIETTTFDICPECFTEKLIPWMKEQGAEPTVEETDW